MVEDDHPVRSEPGIALDPVGGVGGESESLERVVGGGPGDAAMSEDEGSIGEQHRFTVLLGAATTFGTVTIVDHAYLQHART
jgi:hypothetical protein